MKCCACVCVLFGPRSPLSLSLSCLFHRSLLRPGTSGASYGAGNADSTNGVATSFGSCRQVRLDGSSLNWAIGCKSTEFMISAGYVAQTGGVSYTAAQFFPNDLQYAVSVSIDTLVAKFQVRTDTGTHMYTDRERIMHEDETCVGSTIDSAPLRRCSFSGLCLTSFRSSLVRSCLRFDFSSCCRVKTQTLSPRLP